MLWNSRECWSSEAAAGGPTLWQVAMARAAAAQGALTTIRAIIPQPATALSMERHATLRPMRRLRHAHAGLDAAALRRRPRRARQPRLMRRARSRSGRAQTRSRSPRRAWTCARLRPTWRACARRTWRAPQRTPCAQRSGRSAPPRPGILLAVPHRRGVVAAGSALELAAGALQAHGASLSFLAPRPLCPAWAALL